MENQEALISIASETIKILVEKLESFFESYKRGNLIYNISWKSRTTLSITNKLKTNIYDLINNILKENNSHNINFWNIDLSLEKKLEIVKSIIDSLEKSSKNYKIHYLTYIDLPFSFLNGMLLGNNQKKIKIIYYTCDIKNNKKLNNKKSELNFNEDFFELPNTNKITSISFIYSESYPIECNKHEEIKDIIKNSSIIKVTNKNFNNRIITSKKDLKLIWEKVENNLNKLKINELDELEFNIFMACSPQSTFYIGEKFANKYSRFKNCIFKIFFYDFKQKKYTNYLEIGPNSETKIVNLVKK